MNKVLKIILWTVLVLAAIQFIPIDRNNPTINPNDNFVVVEHTPKPIEQLLKKACYDCHSYETKYPNYSYVAPISWSIKHHINSGRKHLNFSTWGGYNDYLKKGAIEQAIATIERNEMPLPSYIAWHPEAHLSAKEKQMLILYFEKLLKIQKAKTPMYSS